MRSVVPCDLISLIFSVILQVRKLPSCLFLHPFSSSKFLSMARRQYFTVDEALSQLLAEEDDFLFGNGDSDSSGEDREEDVRQAQSLATPHSADRQAALEAFYSHFSYFQFTERSYPKKQQPER